MASVPPPPTDAAPAPAAVPSVSLAFLGNTLTSPAALRTPAVLPHSDAAVRLHDVFSCPPRGEAPEFVCMSSYLFDEAWLASELPMFTQLPPVPGGGSRVFFIVHPPGPAATEDQKAQLKAKMEETREKVHDCFKESNIAFVDNIPSFGTMHTKFVFAFYRSTARLAIVSGNLISVDFKHKSESIWWQDFPLAAKPSRPRKEQDFYLTLKRYFNVLGSSGAVYTRTIQMWLDRYDYSGARARLLVSYPTSSKDDKELNAGCGQRLLRQILAADGVALPPPPGTTAASEILVYQCSSLGTLTDDYLDGQLRTTLMTWGSMGDGRPALPARLHELPGGVGGHSATAAAAVGAAAAAGGHLAGQKRPRPFSDDESEDEEELRMRRASSSSSSSSSSAFLDDGGELAAALFGDTDASATFSTAPPSTLPPEPKLQVVWPSAGFIRESTEGWHGGASVPGKLTSIMREDVFNRLLQYRAVATGRDQSVPHIKTLFRGRFLRPVGAPPGTPPALELAWVYTGSHNLSSPAWGTLAKAGTLHCLSYEMGVVVTARSLAGLPLAGAAASSSSSPLLPRLFVLNRIPSAPFRQAALGEAMGAELVALGLAHRLGGGASSSSGGGASSSSGGGASSSSGGGASSSSGPRPRSAAAAAAAAAAIARHPSLAAAIDLTAPSPTLLDEEDDDLSTIVIEEDEEGRGGGGAATSSAAPLKPLPARGAARLPRAPIALVPLPYDLPTTRFPPQAHYVWHGNQLDLDCGPPPYPHPSREGFGVPWCCSLEDVHGNVFPGTDATGLRLQKRQRGHH